MAISGASLPLYRPIPGSLLCCVVFLLLALAAMALRIKRQNARLALLQAEIERLRRENEREIDVDVLTGLSNRAALEKRLESPDGFQGVVAVCDLDNFKSINDRFGHLTGDEVLRNIGNLIRSSVRREDEPFRWGGDEFVILFYGQHLPVVKSRMEALEIRFQGFRVRGYAPVPIAFSWGVVEGANEPLRPLLEQADREMYNHKRRRTQQR